MGVIWRLPPPYLNHFGVETIFNAPVERRQCSCLAEMSSCTSSNFTNQGRGWGKPRELRGDLGRFRIWLENMARSMVQYGPMVHELHHFWTLNNLSTAFVGRMGYPDTPKSHGLSSCSAFNSLEQVFEMIGVFRLQTHPKTKDHVVGFISQMLHAWNIYLHSAQKWPKCG